MKTSFILVAGLALTASSAMANNLNLKLDSGVDISQLVKRGSPNDKVEAVLTAWNNRGDKEGTIWPGLLKDLNNQIVEQRQLSRLGDTINMPFRHASEFHFRVAVLDQSRPSSPTIFVCDKQLMTPFDNSVNYVLDIHSLKDNDCDIVTQK